MTNLRLILLLSATAALSACASVDLPSLEFMGQSDFSDEIKALDPDYPSLDETPDLPAGVRSGAEWDQDAREMEALFDAFDAPEDGEAMTEDEFNAAFDAAQTEAKAYQRDDPS
ncbi:hypothetical protein ACFFUB_11945 [Algimonas porphyrae]|uniref:EF-hand domain-containing protein n=1 Tax=Algimonas porphyrae TaxID=1128113 RepID=A0ABQ5UWN4_9PROT|nr:hypothetical protein [Algimonas porphyrae]GLQ19120.1 hypothetical protein GCM10007854_00750 [Algimonas porphyrae]